jgi:hypothetical protein
MTQKLIPFCVADRPISLSIIKGVSLSSGLKIGIMSQAATTSEQFKKCFASYPYKTDVIYANGEPTDQAIRGRTVKMADSGIFGKNGCDLTYKELFSAYRLMKTEYGIIIDVFGDCDETIRSARKALKAYDDEKDQFKLVGVAQGETISAYLRCYEKLVKLGYSHIALGGLLRKRKNTVRYAHLRGSTFLEKLLKQVRAKFDPDWLFLLGVFHPKRVELFHEYGVWGSDCKGWIFNYLKQEEVVKLIRDKDLEGNCRVAFPELRIRQVKKMSEQELRFKLTRGHIERRVLGACNGETKEKDPA